MNIIITLLLSITVRIKYGVGSLGISAAGNKANRASNICFAYVVCRCGVMAVSTEIKELLRKFECIVDGNDELLWFFFLYAPIRFLERWRVIDRLKREGEWENNYQWWEIVQTMDPKMYLGNCIAWKISNFGVHA